MSHPSSVNLLIDSLKSISIKSDNVDLQEHVECIIQGIHLFSFLHLVFFHEFVAMSPNNCVFYVMERE